MADETTKTEGSTGGATLPDELTETVSKLTSDLANRAVTARFKQLEKSMASSMEQLLSQKLEPFMQAQTAKSGKKGKGDEESQGPDPVLYNSLNAKIAELEAKAAAADAKERAVSARLRNNELRKAAEQEFISAGGDPNMVEYALDHLIDAKKRLVIEDDGDEYRFVFKKEDGTEVDVKTGFKEFMKTEKAKPFSKAKPVTGSGSRITGNFTAQKPLGRAAAEEAMAKIISGGFNPGSFNE